MRVFKQLDALPDDARGTVVAIGNFDGVHRGHQEVIAEAAAVARVMEAPLAAMAFEPHPRRYFKPDDAPFRLTPEGPRTRLLAEHGVDLHYLPSFDAGFAGQSAHAFVEHVLVKQLGARHVTVGYDFHYGRGRQGNAESLLTDGRRYGFGVTVVTQAADETGGIYSSSRIREALKAAQPQHAAEALGRPFEIEGPVLKGDQRGRLLGYPTANIDLNDYQQPAFGVYAVRCAVAEDDPPQWRDGVANLGIRPMFEVDRPLLEAHLFDFDGDLYGRVLRVQLVAYLRTEIRFRSIDELIAQMNDDSAAARAILSQ